MPRYVNLDGTTPDKGLRDLLKWQIRDRIVGPRRGGAPGFVTPRRENDGSGLLRREAHLTWIGHASFVFRLGGVLVATDPVFAARMGPRRRLAPPGVAPTRLPPLDLITVSHAHYDHLDVPRLRMLAARGEPLFVVPKDNAPLLRAAGIENVRELGWWESTEAVGIRVTCVPAQHWSMRMPWDRNTRLWGGFVYEGAEGVAYHAGDTALGEDVFRAIAQRCPLIDWAMLPIGAYDPTWFMSSQHMGPEEAGRALQLLGARILVAMHWGTFKLTDEPPGEPPERAKAWFTANGYPNDRLWVLDVGETRALTD
ncbi:MAG TPA: MBL fold metallo-hydrolase [Polyangiaceae bacterium]|nr:MBL fold metallo-hydrolase [Polyangiaceae bacterium]